tara:strand:- start:22679 stop:23290 length:612 start_codon:yes stop_codon:yes gene_type:complete
MALKHVGRVKSNKRKVIVAYRVVPGDAESCIIVTTENLMAEEHDALIKAVESDAGQSAYEFGEAMARVVLPDGRNMLAAFHATGKMIKLSSSAVEMTPDNKTTLNLAELNKIIAEQRGVSVDDLALKDKNAKAIPTQDVVLEEVDLDTPAEVKQAAQLASTEVLTDDELAAKYRSDADRLSKEAAALRRQAEDLVPTKKAKKS